MPPTNVQPWPNLILDHQTTNVQPWTVLIADPKPAHLRPYPTHAQPYHVQPYPCSTLPMFNPTYVQPYPCPTLPMFNPTNVQPYLCTILDNCYTKPQFADLFQTGFVVDSHREKLVMDPLGIDWFLDILTEPQVSQNHLNGNNSIASRSNVMKIF